MLFKSNLNGISTLIFLGIFAVMKTKGEPGKYFNVMPAYVPFLKNAVERGLWIKQSGAWWGPYDWADRFGVTWMTKGFEPEMKSPYDLLKEGLSVVESLLSRGIHEAELIQKRERCKAFEGQIKDYYQSQKDIKLIRSIESGLWVR